MRIHSFYVDHVADRVRLLSGDEGEKYFRRILEDRKAENIGELSTAYRMNIDDIADFVINWMEHTKKARTRVEEIEEKRKKEAMYMYLLWTRV